MCDLTNPELLRRSGTAWQADDRDHQDESDTDELDEREQQVRDDAEAELRGAELHAEAMREFGHEDY